MKLNLKTILLPLLFVYFFLFVTQILFAQGATSDCVVTRIGDPEGNPSPPTGCDNTISPIPPETTPSDPDGTPPSESCKKAPEYPSDLQGAIKDTFAITMINFDDDHLKWTWDMLWCFSGTKFNTLVKGTVVEGLEPENVGDSRMSCMENPCYIWIGKMPDRPTSFTFLLTHELGHVINYANPREEIEWTAHENAYAQEQGISYYGNNAAACTGSENIPEDYADMISYYLNPKAGETTPACDPNKTPPNPFFELKEFPLHLEVVEKILL